MDILLTDNASQKELEDRIRGILNENYILMSEGETREDCMVHDIICMIMHHDKDQARKIVEGVEEKFWEWPFFTIDETAYSITKEDWQAIRKAAGLEE